MCIHANIFLPLPKPTLSSISSAHIYACWCFLSCLFSNKWWQLMLELSVNKVILTRLY